MKGYNDNKLYNKDIYNIGRSYIKLLFIFFVFIQFTVISSTSESCNIDAWCNTLACGQDNSYANCGCNQIVNGDVVYKAITGPDSENVDETLCIGNPCDNTICICTDNFYSYNTYRNDTCDGTEFYPIDAVECLLNYPVGEQEECVPVTESPTSVPSESPSEAPSELPSSAPSELPSSAPSELPSSAPSELPSSAPNELPSSAPSELPSSAPSELPSSAPSELPSSAPSELPSSAPSELPSESPSELPSESPSELPSSAPSELPSSVAPSELPSSAPSELPSSAPSELPSSELPSSELPSESPSELPSSAPSELPSSAPSELPSSAPSELPSSAPSELPSSAPSELPSSAPSELPSSAPSELPSSAPSELPSSAPSELPSSAPSELPSSAPSELPSSAPSELPSSAPSELPSSAPSELPSSAPSELPSSAPSELPSSAVSEAPSEIPSELPSSAVSEAPSEIPSELPSSAVSEAPSELPSSPPSELPSSTNAPTPAGEMYECECRKYYNEGISYTTSNACMHVSIEMSNVAAVSNVHGAGIRLTVHVGSNNIIESNDNNDNVDEEEVCKNIGDISGLGINLLHPNNWQNVEFKVFDQPPNIYFLSSFDGNILSLGNGAVFEGGEDDENPCKVNGDGCDWVFQTGHKSDDIRHVSFIIAPTNDQIVLSSKDIHDWIALRLQKVGTSCNDRDDSLKLRIETQCLSADSCTFDNNDYQLVLGSKCSTLWTIQTISITASASFIFMIILVFSVRIISKRRQRTKTREALKVKRSSSQSNTRDENRQMVRLSAVIGEDGEMKDELDIDGNDEEMISISLQSHGISTFSNKTISTAEYTTRGTRTLNQIRGMYSISDLQTDEGLTVYEAMEGWSTMEGSGDTSFSQLNQLPTLAQLPESKEDISSSSSSSNNTTNIATIENVNKIETNKFTTTTTTTVSSNNDTKKLRKYHKSQRRGSKTFKQIRNNGRL